MARARIVLADDHPLFREGLVSLLNAQPDLAVVGQASDGLEALTLVRDLQPDLVIMDANSHANLKRLLRGAGVAVLEARSGLIRAR